MPVTSKNGKLYGTMKERNPWPICSQPPCTCTSTQHGNIQEHLQVIRFSCNETYDTFTDIKGNAFIAPKRINCGTYEPSQPTFESRCTCPDIGERKYFELLVN